MKIRDVAILTVVIIGFAIFSFMISWAIDTHGGQREFGQPRYGHMTCIAGEYEVARARGNRLYLLIDDTWLMVDTVADDCLIYYYKD